MHEAELKKVVATIRELAERHQVRHAETSEDVLAHHFTRLSGDDVELDEAGRLLLALERGGHLTGEEATRLHADYLRAKYE